MKEIWKDIKGYEGLYRVSNLGRVQNKKTLHILKGSINNCLRNRSKSAGKYSWKYKEEI